MNTANQNYEYNNKDGPHAINFFFFIKLAISWGVVMVKNIMLQMMMLLIKVFFFFNIKLAISISLRGLFFSPSKMKK